VVENIKALEPKLDRFRFSETHVLEKSQNALGMPGTAKRHFFSGQGLDNCEFGGVQPLSACHRNTGSSTFGQVVSANPPRLVQMGAKFFF
jgi:hypothetical protein